eukprot:2801256-Alexandrium_andersonii.AAC.1
MKRRHGRRLSGSTPPAQRQGSVCPESRSGRVRWAWGRTSRTSLFLPWQPSTLRATFLTGRPWRSALRTPLAVGARVAAGRSTHTLAR